MPTMGAEAAPALAPCPFCGGAAGASADGDRWRVACEGGDGNGPCGASMASRPFSGAPGSADAAAALAEAAAAWNARCEPGISADGVNAGLMLVYAERYASGRRTFAPRRVASVIAGNAHLLTPGIARTLALDITEAGEDAGPLARLLPMLERASGREAAG